MEESAWLASRFEEHRGHLRAVAYRMLGSLPDADDAVQDAWARFSQSGADGVENLRGWLTTIVARVCLNTMRARTSRREEPMGMHVPDLIISLEDANDPETETLLADSVGLALIVVLDTLTPSERLAFVLHDLFDVRFDDIGPMIGRSPSAARQLASRGRRRVHGADLPTTDADIATQRALVEAFFAAARCGDFDGLVALLAPDVVLRVDGGDAHPEASAASRGADAAARQALRFPKPATDLCPVLVNGVAGVVLTANGRPVGVMGFTVVGGRIVEIDGIIDPDRVDRLSLGFLDRWSEGTKESPSTSRSPDRPLRGSVWIHRDEEESRD